MKDFFYYFDKERKEEKKSVGNGSKLISADGNNRRRFAVQILPWAFNELFFSITAREMSFKFERRRRKDLRLTDKCLKNFFLNYQTFSWRKFSIHLNFFPIEYCDFKTTFSPSLFFLFVSPLRVNSKKWKKEEKLKRIKTLHGNNAITITCYRALHKTDTTFLDILSELWKFCPPAFVKEKEKINNDIPSRCFFFFCPSLAWVEARRVVNH